MPLLEAALTALDTLSKNDITEVKSMKSPPAAVKLVMEAVCQMMSIKPKRINDPADPSKKINDFWGPSQALLSDANFLLTLRNYDKDNIAPAIITIIRWGDYVLSEAVWNKYMLCCRLYPRDLLAILGSRLPYSPILMNFPLFSHACFFIFHVLILTSSRLSPVQAIH